MDKKKLYFALFYPEPTPRIVVETREAELVGNTYRFETVGCLRSRVTTDELGTLFLNDMAVGEDEAQVVGLLRECFVERAVKHERKAEKLRAYSNLAVEHK